MNGRIASRLHEIFITLVVTCSVVLAVWCGTRTAQAAVPETWYGDARLNDIQFVDDQHGLAVGDHGTIWQTRDGGANWQQVPSGTEAHLTSLHLLDARHGWAVGGEPLPYSENTRGVVLRTSDGGSTWQRMPEQSLPKLSCVQFEDSQHGWVLGATSHLFPSGLFETNDGGRSWRSLPGAQGTTFHRFATLPSGELLLAGEGGSLSLADRGGIRKPTLQTDPLRTMRDVVVAGTNFATAVGDGGLILTSTNAGASWETVPQAPLPRTMRQLDLHAVERLGQHIWAAGSPGSVVLYSGDGGSTWEVRRTPTSVPLQALFFRDENSGWAAGALGTILHTNDGGRTWTVQHQGGERLALLGILHDPGMIPFELLSHHAGSQGYLSGIEILNRPYPKTGQKKRPLHEALAFSGGSFGHTAWQFPAESPELRLDGDKLTTGWNAVNDGQGLLAAESYLVRLIRQWRPSVVVTDHADPTGKQPMAYLVNQLVLSAVEKAANAEAFPEHESELGLEPWSVPRVCSLMPEGSRGSISINTTQISPQLAMSLSEHAGIARGVASGQMSDGPTTVELKVLRSSELVEGRLTDLFSGLSLPAGKGARRPPQAMPIGDLAQLQRISQKRRNLMEMINHTFDRQQGNPIALGQMQRLADELPPQRGAEVMFHLAQQANRKGNLTLAADIHQQVVTKHAGSTLAERSAAWLLGYYASEEIRHVLNDTVEFATPRPLKDISQEATEDESADEAGDELATVSFDKPENYRKPTEATAAGVELIRQLTRTMPHMLSDPSLAFPLEKLHAAQGHSRQGEAYVRRLLNLGQDHPWCQRAQWELVLGRGEARLDAPIYRADFVEEKPVLDGKLDDQLWHGGKPLDLQTGTTSTDQGAPAAAVLMTYDEEFLYLAIRCKKSTGLAYVPDTGEPRPRDANLQETDRVHLYFDLDRDYATFYRFTVDYRGWTAEALGDNVAWNPHWFVAATQDAATWTVEAAIPLAELTGKPIRPGAAWGMAAQRVIVGHGTLAWPAAGAYELGPEHFGLLQFR